MTIQVVSDLREHFKELIQNAGQEMKIEIKPALQDYLIQVMEFYSETSNLYPKHGFTLAELWLYAQNAVDAQEQFERLKDLGDRSLYISGFFADSLQRKLVDIDYYMRMGEMAFISLAHLVKIETHSYVYRTLAQQFSRWVDIFSYVATKSSLNSDADLLRLYEKFLKTGSEVAYQQLLERGVVTLNQDQLKKAKQDIE